MDYVKLFDMIGLREEGREHFAKLHARTADPLFCDALDEAIREYDKGDDEFTVYLNDFAKRENVSPEVMNLYIYIRLSERTLNAYHKRGIDDAIFYDTMREIEIDCRSCSERHGIYGITQPVYRRWLRNHLGNRIYRFGRLQFELIESPYSTTIGEVAVEKGDTLLSAHIPSYEKLDPAEAEKSYDRAREFFTKYYGLEKCVFYCDSWLLHPWIGKDMPETSNIVKFQSRYKTLEVVEDPMVVIRHVFSKVCDDVNDYPEDTSLRRALKRRLIEKLPLGSGIGVRL